MSTGNIYNYLPKIISTILLTSCLLLTTATQAGEKEDMLFDFTTPDQINAWRIVNDGVMGGLSQSQMQLSADSTAIFEGRVSLDNNGGFASVRTIPAPYNTAGYE